ncbi:phage baseplate assembly protein [Parasutterella sp.]|uniref:phage baseplate assembly protein n=1 Tax=Parasutterella sp. TaxID=2049037 RepID=UPI003520D16F
MNTKNDPTADLNKVSIEVDGVRYEGWKSARIDMSIDQICRAFVLSVTDNFPGNHNFSRLQPGQKVVLKIGEDTVCTGYITATPISYDARSVTVQVQGKSKTVDLVDCCSPWAAIASSPSSASEDQWKDVKTTNKQKLEVKPAKTVNTSWHNQTPVQIISDLCAPYGIRVICEIKDFNSKIVNFTVNPGEKVVDSINRLLTKDNLIVTDNEYGDLVIAEVGKNGSCHDELQTGKNILSGSAGFDASKIFSIYAVLGQHKGSDIEYGKLVSQDKGLAYDSSIGRYRLVVIKDTGQSSNTLGKSRAEFEAIFRRAQALMSKHKVQGWRQSDNSLWKTNSLVRIKDEFLKVSGEFLIQRLELTLDSAGTVAAIDTISSVAYTRKGSSQSVKKNEVKTTDNWGEVK